MPEASGMCGDEVELQGFLNVTKDLNDCVMYICIYINKKLI